VDLRLVVTPGDPRGIGPEVAVHAVERFLRDQPGADVRLWGPDGPASAAGYAALVEAARGAGTGADATSGTVAARSIEGAVARALAGDVHAVVTAPLHKPSLHAAGRRFPGQTEMLRSLAGVDSVGMLMAAERTRLGPPLRVLLATTHLPLRAVVDALSAELLVAQMVLLDAALRTDWGMPEPRIGVCGVNPHASDGGLFGDEEARIVVPAVEEARRRGIQASGPLPADTVFSRALGGAFDAVVAPYHDVGMAPFKTVSFGGGVNVTIGLPFVRTSPDHGTAFDIAGTGSADPASMLEALRLAHRLASRRFDTASADV
jgi:4-hydroxythreonine-4-phosphate dehydrogenase